MAESIPWAGLTPEASASIRSILEDPRSYDPGEAARLDEPTLERVASALTGFVFEYVQRPGGASELRYLSSGFERLTGYPPDAFLGAPARALDVVHPDDRQEIAALHQREAVILEPRIDEHRLVTRDGRARWLRAYATPTPQPDGSILWSGISLDVTDFKLLEDEKRRLQHKLAVLAEQLPGVFYEYRLYPDGRAEVPFLSRGFDELLGVSSDAIVEGQKDPMEYVLPEDRPRLLESMRVSAEALSPWQLDYRVRDARGGIRWLQGTGFPRREPDGSTVWLSVAFDITAIRQAEAERRRMESRLEAFFESASEAHIVIERDYSISAFNAVADELSRRFTGRGLALGQSMRSAMPTPQQYELFVQTVSPVFEGQVVREEQSSPTATGEARALRIRYEPVRTEQGIEAVSLSVRDVTQEQAIFEEQKLAAAVVSELPIAVVLLDEQGRVARWLGAAERLLGHRPEQARGRVFFGELFEGEPVPVGTPVADRWIRGPDGRSLRVAVSHRTLSEELSAQASSLVLVVDVSEQRSLQEQLRQAQKMDALGLMAGGVAHDFNNLLTALLGHSSLARDAAENGRPHEVVPELQGIEAAVARASQLTAQLLAFARKEVREAHPQAIAPLLSSFEELLRRAVGETVSLSLEIAPELGWARAATGQLEQVVLNLALNARDAMPQGGRLLVRAENAVSPRGVDSVRVRVRDTGTGIDPAIRDRILEPFFTTKARGRGTGLGLSTCFGIVRQLGGELVFESEPGRGTTFDVYLPRHPSAPGSNVEPKSAQPRVVGSACILLVEDDEHLRSSLARGLESRGFRVLEAGSPAQAERHLSGEGPIIDLLLTDVVMPEKSGVELSKQYLASHPKGRVLFISGYAGQGTDPAELVAPRCRFLAKPFSLDELAAQIREALE